MTMTRRELLLSAVIAPLGKSIKLTVHAEPVNTVAGVDRVVMRNGKTYLSAWVGYGEPPRPVSRGARGAAPTPPPVSGPPSRIIWSKVTGPGNVTFADPRSAVTTAAFSSPGEYVLQIHADNGETQASSSLTVKVEIPPPPA